MTRKKLKVATIGGGSSYTPELIEGFIRRYNEFPITELWLVDVEQGKEKLNTVGNLAKRMVKKAGLPIDIYLTLDRKKALANADFVTTQIRVGQLSARAKDERIPLEHDVIGQETNGAGGLFKGLRTIPVILDICKEMEELCPAAWLINFTNPAGMITEAVLRHSKLSKVIGLCNVPINMEKGIANLFNVDSSRIRINFAGLNHMVYGLDVFLDGKSIKEKTMQKLSTKENSNFVKNIGGANWVREFLVGLNAIPCPYHVYYYKTADKLKEMKEHFQDGKTRAEIVKSLEDELFELYQNEEIDEKPVQLEERGGAYYSDAAVNLITSIYTDKCDIQTVNTKNRGAISSIAPDEVVEVSSIITKEGPIPLAVGELPIATKGLVQQIKSFERVAIDAAINGDFNKVVLALTINPLISSDVQAKIIVKEMLEAHKEYLPQFSN